MDQKKIGRFIKELRNEKGLTQEQLAELVGVTNRSVSRWENGVNMPDFDLLIHIAQYFDVSIEEILDGERKGEGMDKAAEKTMLKVADYNSSENMIFSKRLNFIFAVSLIAFIIYMIIDINGLALTGVYEDIADFMLGLVFGVLILGTLYTSRYMLKIKAFKMRLLNRVRHGGESSML